MLECGHSVSYCHTVIDGTTAPPRSLPSSVLGACLPYWALIPHFQHGLDLQSCRPEPGDCSSGFHVRLLSARTCNLARMHTREPLCNRSEGFKTTSPKCGDDMSFAIGEVRQKLSGSGPPTCSPLACSEALDEGLVWTACLTFSCLRLCQPTPPHHPFPAATGLQRRWCDPILQHSSISLGGGLAPSSQHLDPCEFGPILDALLLHHAEDLEFPNYRQTTHQYHMDRVEPERWMQAASKDRQGSLIRVQP
ncbi:hypothetical protein LIA77_10774 [Sarocladium implicatum]|nr:hypothetical protein LIA77_10774 [Sarocladium implicatum]